MFKRKCKITFIAHGSTIYSEENRFSDKLDYPPLNETGYNEMQKITEFIKKRGLKTNKIYSSPALRCVQSAEIISDELKQDFETLENLTNRKFGVWSGLTFEQIEKKYKTEDIKSTEIMFQCPENGEHLDDFKNRVNEQLQKIISLNHRGRVIVVTHPAVIQAAISNALDIPSKSIYKIYIRPASATQISYYTDWASLVYADHIPV